MPLCFFTINKTFLYFFAFPISRSKHGVLSASVPVFLPQQLSVHGRPDSLCSPSPSPYRGEVRLKCHVISSASMLSVSTLDKDSLGGAGGGAVYVLNLVFSLEPQELSEALGRNRKYTA